MTCFTCGGYYKWAYWADHVCHVNDIARKET